MIDRKRGFAPLERKDKGNGERDASEETKEEGFHGMVGCGWGLKFSAELGGIGAEFAGFAVVSACGASRLRFNAPTAEPEAGGIAAHRVFLVG